VLKCFSPALETREARSRSLSRRPICTTGAGCQVSRDSQRHTTGEPQLCPSPQCVTAQLTQYVHRSPAIPSRFLSPPEHEGLRHSKRPSPDVDHARECQLKSPSPDRISIPGHIGYAVHNCTKQTSLETLFCYFLLRSLVSFSHLLSHLWTTCRRRLHPSPPTCRDLGAVRSLIRRLAVGTGFEGRIHPRTAHV
jgi:hypothetical protein